MVKGSSSKPASKTKLLATRRKSGHVFKAKTEGKPAEVLLGKLMEQYLVDINAAASFADILSGLGMNDRNTTWRNVWKKLHADGLTVQKDSGGFFTSGFQLTEKGRDEASTEEMKEMMAKTDGGKPKTNEELHASIKSKLMNQRGEQIFDLLLKNKALSRKELAEALGISDTGAYFSYALQELKEKGYAENVRGEGKGNKVSLTDKAFVSSRDEFEASQGAVESKRKVAAVVGGAEEDSPKTDDAEVMKKEQKKKRQKVTK